ncbi:ATP-grasp domain-containing protein [Neobacillus sp. LXY-4]|uniref:ATP-grasp domain-containing protein n=1 Tax=Neobacillus sp. LXY-4 TaxID=3379826 RepID=UPI003EE322FC
MNIIIIGCHRGLTRCVIKSLKNTRMKFLFIGTNELTKSVALSKFCKSCHEIEEKDLHIDSITLIEIIKTKMSTKEKNFIIPTGIRSTLYVSKYARVIDDIENCFPISDYNILKMLNNKWDFYSFLMKHNIATPMTKLLETEETQIKNNDLFFPVITKPLDSENSQNVIRSDNYEELFEVTRRTNTQLLVQEFIPGYDVNLCIFSINGKINAWTINSRTDKGLVFEENKEILQIGEAIVEILNFTGLIHFDLRINKQDGIIKVIECNPRVWGSILHSVYAGVNFLELAVNSQNSTFNKIEPGTVSLNKISLMNNLKDLSITSKDIKSIFIQAKYFFSDPIYELDFVINNK